MQATNSVPASTTSQLDECHNLVLEYLRPHIKKMFENCDTAFMEFAEKAQSNISQSGFFEAMAVVQKNRANMEEIFYKELDKSFLEFGSAKNQPGQTGVTGEDPLSLVSKEDMDIETSKQNMVTNAVTGSGQTLMALRQRLAILNHGQKLEEEDIPGGPSCLAKAYHMAASSLALEHQTRLIIYMLFGKFVLGTSDQMYYEYNELLLKAGLLPNLKYEVRINPSRVKSVTGEKAEFSSNNSGRNKRNSIANSIGNTDANSNADGGSNSSGHGSDNNEQSLSDELFGNIMQLLSRKDSLNQSNDSEASGQQSTVNSSPIPKTELVSALHQLQQNRSTDNPESSNIIQPVSGVRESRQLEANLISNLSAERERLYDGIDRRRLPAADARVIDLVGMMFEYMLKDDGIPSVAKAELSRLHTPYLKVAIIDNTLFTDSGHPAHALLNALAKAAARCVFENNLDRGIFPSIHDSVERIIAEFESNTDIFSEILTLFRASVHEMEIKSAAAEKRACQAAEGKEKLSRARQHAASAIRECMEEHDVPAPIRTLLNDVWQEKLMFIFLREPESDESYSWQLAIQTIKAIIWSVEPRITEQAQSELRKKLPETLQQIEQTVETLRTYGNNETEPQLKLIRKTQQAALSESASPTGLPGTEHPAASSLPEKIYTDTIDAENSIEPVDKHLAVELKAAMKNLEKTAFDDESSIEPADEDLTDEVKAAMKDLENIAFGTWFLIQKDEETLPERVKLSWYSHISGNYMFVDSMGIKTKVRKHTELAAMMVANTARILQEEKQPLVRRALEAIRQILSGGQSNTT